MLPRIISPILIVSARKLIPIFFIISGLVSSCTAAPRSSPEASTVEPTQTAAAEALTPAAQAPESTADQTSVNDTVGWFSSDQLGLCFSYPQGYTQVPYEDTVEIVAPSLGPNIELRALFWLEKSDSYDRTAEVIADQDMTAAGLSSVGRSFLTLDGEQAVVLDGMPGQDLQRRVYVVHEQTLYVLAFMPTRSENAAANDQMETLYEAVTSSWAWSPCPASN